MDIEQAWPVAPPAGSPGPQQPRLCTVNWRTSTLPGQNEWREYNTFFVDVQDPRKPDVQFFECNITVQQPQKRKKGRICRKFRIGVIGVEFSESVWGFSIGCYKAMTPLTRLTSSASSKRCPFRDMAQPGSVSGDLAQNSWGKKTLPVESWKTSWECP